MNAPGLLDEDIGHFAADYREARAKFLAAAAALNGVVESYDHPWATGPDGEALSCDTVLLGAPDASAILVVTSGTHGVEGFGGSGCQVGFMRGLARHGLPDMAILLVHALNPYGFAHLHRTDEVNVDVNRNFVDHHVLRPSPEYDEVHPLLLPDDWNGPDHSAANARLRELIEHRGIRDVQSAITRGQYTHQDGLFFGGQGPTWSNTTWRSILARQVTGRAHVGFIDLHTGLGPYGTGEAIFRLRYDGGGYERASRWYGGVTSSEQRTSVSTEIQGTTHWALSEAAGDAEVTTVTLEFGTRGGGEVLSALRADNWLRHKGPGEQDNTVREIKQAIRSAFYPDEDDWKSAVLRRAGEVLTGAVRGLSTSVGEKSLHV